MSSKLAKTANVTEIEHFWHSGHFQKEIVMIYESLRRLILISLADKEKLKAWKPIDALWRAFSYCNSSSKLAETAIVQWDLGFFWKRIPLKFKYFMGFIPVYLANDDIQKTRKFFYGQQGESIIVNGWSKVKIIILGFWSLKSMLLE